MTPKKCKTLNICLLSLFGALFSLSLQAMLPQSKAAGALLVGAAAGALIGLVAAQCFPTAFSKLTALRVAAFASPLPLLLGFFFDFARTRAFFLAWTLVCFALFCAAFIERGYSPSKKLTVALSYGAVAFVAAFLCFSTHVFSPDASSLYELSKTVGGDFFHINTIRQYVELTDYGISFPYLYPTLVFAVNALTGLGIYSGTMINLFIAALSVLALLRLSRVMFTSELPGAAAAFLLLCNPYYLNELCSARTIPLAILCLCAAVGLLYDIDSASPRRALLAGLALGLGVAARFAMMSFAACAFVFVAVFAKKQRLKKLLLFTLALALPLVPWAVYSLSHFGRLWATDNAGTMFLVDTQFPTRFYTEFAQPATLWNSPGEWFSSLFGVKLPKVLGGLRDCVIKGGGCAFGLAALLTAFFTDWKAVKAFAANKRLSRSLICCLIALLANLAALVAVGYADERYHLELWLFVVFAVFGLLCAGEKKGVGLRAATLFCCLAAALQVALSPLISSKANGKAWADSAIAYSPLDAPLLDGQALYGSALTHEISAVVTGESDSPRVLFTDWRAYEFGASTGITTFCEPVIDMQRDTFGLQVLINNYIKPDYIVTKDEALVQRLGDAFGLELCADVEGFGVYKVTDSSSYGDELINN